MAECFGPLTQRGGGCKPTTGMGRKPGCWRLVLAVLLFCTPALAQNAAAAQPLPHRQAPTTSFRGGGTISVADEKRAAAFTTTNPGKGSDAKSTSSDQYASTTVEAQPPVAAHFAAAKAASNDKAFATTNDAKGSNAKAASNTVDEKRPAAFATTNAAKVASNTANEVESRLFENTIGQLRRSKGALFNKFKTSMKSSAKKELKAQGKEYAAGELESMIDGMSQEEFARHYCAREGWEGYCVGHQRFFPPNVQKGPGNRCDCTPGYCWEYTGKTDPWYAYGWECKKDKSDMKAWIAKNTKENEDEGQDHGQKKFDGGEVSKGDDELSPEEEAGVIAGGVITIIVACCCLSACFYKLVRCARAGNDRGRDNGPMPLQQAKAPCCCCCPAGKSSSPSAVPEPVTAAKPISVAMPNANGVCQGCGTVKTARFCGSCGRDNGPMLPVSPPTPAPQKFCPGCGTVKTARFCGSCGRDNGPMLFAPADVGSVDPATAPVPNKPMMAAAALGVGGAAAATAGYAGGEASAPPIQVSSMQSKMSSMLEKGKVAATKKAGEMAGSKLGQTLGGMIFGNDEDEED